MRSALCRLHVCGRADFDRDIYRAAILVGDDDVEFETCLESPPTAVVTDPRLSVRPL